MPVRATIVHDNGTQVYAANSQEEALEAAKKDGLANPRIVDVEMHEDGVRSFDLAKQPPRNPWNPPLK